MPDIFRIRQNSMPSAHSMCWNTSPEDETVLRQVAKALRPGGRLLITVPQHQFLWSATDETAHHVRRYSCQSDLRAKTERAGFHVLRVSSFVSFLLPLMLYLAGASVKRNRLRPS